MAAHRVPSPSDAFYAATKHGLRALAEGLRQEASADNTVMLCHNCGCGCLGVDVSDMHACGICMHICSLELEIAHCVLSQNMAFLLQPIMPHFSA